MWRVRSFHPSLPACIALIRPRWCAYALRTGASVLKTASTVAWAGALRSQACGLTRQMAVLQDR